MGEIYVVVDRAQDLIEHPCNADKCKWEFLNGNDWSSLLSAQPQFADRCKWEMLNGEDWSHLLFSQIQFANKCTWEKLVGKKTIGMPDENSSEEEWAKLYDRLGRPVAADKYEVKRAEGLPPELIDEEGMKSFLGAAYKAGLNQKQVSALVSEFDRQLLEGAKRSAAAEEARKGEAVSELRKLWGSDLQEKVERAQQTLNILDPQETIDREKLRNNVQVIQLLSSFSDKVLGDTLPKGTDGGPISDIEDRLAVLMSSPAFANEMSLDHDKIMTEYKMLMQKRSALRRR